MTKKEKTEILADALEMLKKQFERFNQSLIIELMLFQRESLTMLSYEFYNKLRHEDIHVFSMNEFENFVKADNELTRVKYILVSRHTFEMFENYALNKINETN